MKPLLIVLLASALPLVGLAAGSGGKSSRQHEQARAAKAEAEQAAAEAKKNPDAAKPAEDRDPWIHRPVRHKQTMPAEPTRDASQK